MNDKNVMDFDVLDWQSIQQAASESKWMPPEYMRNEWVSDVCSFLRDGPYQYDPVPPAGGDVEVPTVAWLDLNKMPRAGMAYATALKVNHRQTELVDRAKVTRLQADVDHWSRLWGKAISAGAGLEEERDALQAELTSAIADKNAFAQNAIDLRKQLDALKAEVERLKQDSGERYESMLKLANGVAELKSELTKALEDASKWKLAHRLAMEDNFKLTKARELLRISLDLPFSIAHQRHIELFLSNQSSPSDKVD